MTPKFSANGLPLLIGSLPLHNHAKGVELVFEYTPEIPLWVQLPAFKEEGMIAQFQPGFPGLTIKEQKSFVDTSNPSFDKDILGFYEDFMTVSEKETNINGSRFAMDGRAAGGFFAFTEHLRSLSRRPMAVKGQITGPITFGLGLCDQNGKAVFYDDQLRDVAIKLLAQKGRWQVRKLSEFGSKIIIFLDEPALAGFGSSAMISVSREEVAACFSEVIGAVHEEGGFAGIHVCANADWSLILESEADIISFDAYSFFDKLMLYPEHVRRFMESGKILAWGIVPTLNRDDIEKETVESLVERWEAQSAALEAFGFDRSVILAQTLITPACGTGSLTIDLANKVLALTRHVSDTLKKKYGSES
jgi:methionine synthase II (cobalamin-independent)